MQHSRKTPSKPPCYLCLSLPLLNPPPPLPSSTEENSPLITLHSFPQDAPLAGAIGTRSYNDLVAKLVTILGAETPKALLTPALSGRSFGSNSRSNSLISRTSSAGPVSRLASRLSSSLHRDSVEALRRTSGSLSAPPLPAAELLTPSSAPSLDDEDAKALQLALSLSLSAHGVSSDALEESPEQASEQASEQTVEHTPDVISEKTPEQTPGAVETPLQTPFGEPRVLCLVFS